jgi:hypothetical protein
MTKLTEDERKFLEEQTFENMAEYYRDELLIIHQTGQVKKIHNYKDYLAARLMRLGLTQKNKNRFWRTTLTERALKYFGWEEVKK